ncbi:hypothetical protein B0H13DRAFT_2236758 [Mycena leptocephala]|nr:hypothetical protein B0H13DRAFT_2236758 [Mycena leptocephala]
MAVSAYNFIGFLQAYFPGGLSLERTLYIIAILSSLYPLFRLHKTQRCEPHQPAATGWYRSIERQDPHIWLDEGPEGEYAEQMCNDLEDLYYFLGITGSAAGEGSFFPKPRPILGIHSLRRDFQWVVADLFLAFCQSCDAEYHLDRITYHPHPEQHPPATARHGIWVHRRIALAQENAVLNFHSGWSNFAQCLSDTIGKIPALPFDNPNIDCCAWPHGHFRLSNTNSQVIANTIREYIGANGGVVAGAMSHGCSDCTHMKCYKSNLLAAGVALDDRADGVTNDPTRHATADPRQSQEEIPGEPNLLYEPRQEEPPADGRRGYTRLAAMDGKTITHEISAVTICQNDLVNYKNGRFCEAHLDLRNICGIVTCGQPIHSAGVLTCDERAHKVWHSQYLNRFARQSFPGVQRVIRKQTAGQSRIGTAAITAAGPSLHPTLPSFKGVEGTEVSHTFRARKIYCLQTIQWAFGCPIGWGKCYTSESSSQVLEFINRVWVDNPESKPGFIAYDDACNLLRHIVTQDPEDLWIKTTRFIVDSWHYIGHCATDVLCRLWCNPAPTNGSQPDLVTVQVDENGRTHTTRAFNTETAEQLNAWISGFESQLQQMSAKNYDFTVHVIMLLYKEKVDRRIMEKRTGLSKEFWDAVEGRMADDN